MIEYIKREDAMAHPFANENYDHQNANMDFIFGIESYREWLETLPAADVRENVHGKWIRGSRSDRCPVCGYETGRYAEGMNFCPNCGADMGGGKE